MKLSSGRSTSTSVTTTTSASVSTSFSTDTRPSASSVSPSSAASTTASSSLRQSSTSLAQLLRGVLQTVKTRRKRGEREKFLRALEKSGVDFANALLLAEDGDNNTHPSRSLESNRASTRSNLSSINSSDTISTNRISTRHCMRSLDRIEKLQVRATVESARAGGTLVTLQLLLITSPPRESSGSVPLQQPQLQTQQHQSRGAAGVVVYQGLGALRQQRVYELTRPFDDFRKLRKMVAFCVRRGREHDDDDEHHRHHNNTQNNEAASPQCSYCSEVRLFVAQCWEQPPLLETSMLSSNCTIRKGVLASSMLHFVRLAKSEPLFPPRHAVHGRGALGSGAAPAASGAASAAGNNGASDTNQNGAPLSSPKCQAHAEIATILHDFFRLQQLIVAR